jgi:PPK2 family polyphosphate:nucleotide phosphotransferase
MGCTATAFKVPTPEEAAHDFLWRHHKAAPPKGYMAVHNRSHYEAVLIERVHDIVSKKVWSKRYDEINAFERLLDRNGTTVIKLFLHMSKEEQLERFRDRLDDPLKRWKISEADYSERQLWDDYIEAYEDALEKTSTKYAPWYVVPADSKPIRNYIASQIIADTMAEMKISRPKPSVDLADIRRRYHEAQES